MPCLKNFTSASELCLKYHCTGHKLLNNVCVVQLNSIRWCCWNIATGVTFSPNTPNYSFKLYYIYYFEMFYEFIRSSIVIFA